MPELLGQILHPKLAALDNQFENYEHAFLAGVQPTPGPRVLRL